MGVDTTKPEGINEATFPPELSFKNELSNVKAEANVKPAGSSQFGKPESEPVVLALEGMGVPQTIDGTETATLENTCGVIDLGTTEGISKTRVAVGEGKERKGIAGNCHPPLEEDGPETFGRTGMLEGVTPGGKVKVEVLVKSYRRGYCFCWRIGCCRACSRSIR